MKYYSSVKELPDEIKALTPHLQLIYMKAFNEAWNQFHDPSHLSDGQTKESISHAIAWNEVEKRVKKDHFSGKTSQKNPLGNSGQTRKVTTRKLIEQTMRTKK